MTANTMLTTPLHIGPITVRGRLFKSATSETRATDDGFVTDELLEFYEPMVDAGTPMIITGNLYVSPKGSQRTGRRASMRTTRSRACGTGSTWPIATTSNSSPTWFRR